MAASNVIRLLARYSEGYRLAAEHGPASGIVAEYAYHNTPRGHGPLGRFLDRRFLHQGAWDGVRTRFQATKDSILEEIRQRRAAGLQTTILDVASGTACYLRELVHEDGGPDLEVYCRERDPRLVMHARALAEQEEIDIHFFVGDATDEASYLCARDPDIVVAGGILLALKRDDVVRSVMRLIFRHAAPGGCALIAALTNPQARLSPWEARITGGATIRPSDTLESWLRATGFSPVASVPYSSDGVVLIARKPMGL